MRRMQRRMNRLFGISGEKFDGSDFEMDDYRRAWTEFNETEDQFILEVELPGVDKKDIIIHTADGKLEIRARKKEEVKKEEKGVYSYSRSYSGFARSIQMPEDADLEKIDAMFENGVLEVKIPKKKGKKKLKKEVRVR